MIDEDESLLYKNINHASCKHRFMKKINKLFLLFFLLCLTATAFAQQKKNVLLFLVDDLGWADVGTNGSSFYETPNIDKLAKQGMKFTNAYAACPVCSPTRASIMTGKYPVAMQTTDWFGAVQPQEAKQNNYWNKKKLLPAPYREFLPLEETTIAEAFKANGYTTFIAGKWHLGETPEYWPEHQGFDINKGGNAKGHPDSYFSPYKNPRLTDGPPGKYLGDRLAEEAISFINDNKEKPFFLYFPFYEVHTPLQAKDSLIKKYTEKKMRLGLKDEVEVDGELRIRHNQSLPVYAAMVETMDNIIGDILQKIKDAGQEDNTIVVFFSDNGGLATKEGSPTSNAPLKAGKGWLYEGGIREPLIIKSKGQVKAGTLNNTPVISNDLYPTLLQMCNIPLMPQQHTGGISITPLFSNKQISRDALYWHYPHYGNQGGFPGSAMRMGKWKLIQNFEANTIELYDLSKDIGEKNNLVDKERTLVTTMMAMLDEWRKNNHAIMPAVNDKRIVHIDTVYLAPVLNELRNKWPANRMINIVFDGHSVPSGYFKTPQINTLAAYPNLVFESVSKVFTTSPINVIKTAIGGENAEQGAARFDTSVLNYKPDVLFIDYALNDRKLGLERAKIAWASMIRRALANNIKVVLLTPTPDLNENILDDETLLQQHATQIIDLGKEFHMPVIDSYGLFKELVLQGKDLKLYMAQKNHLNELGHRVVAREILKLFGIKNIPQY